MSRRLPAGPPGRTGPRPAFVTRHPLLLVAVLLSAVFLLGVTSVLLAPADTRVAVWWPAAGLSAVLLLLAPRAWRPYLVLAVALVSALANSAAGRPVPVAAGFGLTNAAEAYVVAWWLTRGTGGRPSLRTMDDLRRLLVATVLGALVIGAGVGATVGLLLGGDALAAARTVTASHGAAILVIAPLALRVGASPLRARRGEAAAQLSLLLTATALVFSPGQDLGLTFLVLPLLIWGALRLGLRAVSIELVLVGVLTSALTVRGWGPFAVSAATGVTDLGTTVSLVQTFLIATAVIALTLAVVVEQKRKATARLQASEQLFRKSFDESFVGMLLLRRDGDGLRIAQLNQTAAEILGGAAEDLEGRAWTPMLATETPVDEVADALLAGTLAGWREETWLASNPGHRVGVAMSLLSTDSDEPMFTAQLIDVTSAHEAAQRLRTEKDFTSAVLDTTGCLIVVVHVDGTVVGMNPAAQRASGYDEEQVAGSRLWEVLVPAEDRATVSRMLAHPASGAAPAGFEGDLLTASGRRRRVVWSNAFLHDEDGGHSHVVMTGIDVTEERTTRRLLDHLLQAASATSFIGTNVRGTITVFNSGAEALLGYSAQELVGHARLDDVHDPDELAARAEELGTAPGFAALVANVDGGAETRDWTYVHKDGSTSLVAVTLTAVRDALGQHIGYLAVGRDVTEQREGQRLLEATLEKERQAAERLRDLDRAKNDFVSTISHELRTPITSIVGYTEMLQDGVAGAVSPDQDRLVDAVRRNGERLIVLIEDLLTLSRIEAGTFVLEKSTVDLRTVLTRAHETLRPMVVGRRLDVRFEVPDEPVLVLGDRGQLERVVLNLVGNAVKFTDDGGRVTCRLDQHGTRAHLEVGDTGIGIPAQEQAALFTRFFRSTTARERAIQGTGLGLSIVQSIVRSHGGEIYVQSEHLVGTRVLVQLPLVAPAELAGAGAH